MKRCTLRARFTASLSSSAKLVHTHDGDDILQFLISLQDLLYFSCYLIMLLSYHITVSEYGSWIPADQQPDKYPDSTISTGKNRCRIQMGKCSCRSRVCKVIGRHINSLNRSNRTLLCRSDSLLKCTHLGCQCRLITYCGRHTSQAVRIPRNQPV